MASADIVVIGAGIMGMASAYHIKRNSPDKEVLVLDRYGAPGQGNTGRSNAMFQNTFSSPDNQVLANSSIEFYLHVQNELKVDIGLQQIGYLWLMSEEQLSASEPFIRRMRSNRIETTTFAVSELRERLPNMVASPGDDEDAAPMELPAISGGIFGPKCGRLDPDKLVGFYRKEFEGMGGKLSLSTSAERLVVAPTRRLGIDGEPLVWQESQVEGVEVSGSLGGIVQAETIVLACGAWENELLGPIGIDGHVKSKKRQLFSIPARGNGDLERLVHARGFNALGISPLVILPKSGVHFRPVSEENAMWVACEDEVNRPFIEVPDHDLDSYHGEAEYYANGVKPVLSSYFPAFSRAGVKAMWAGLYAYNTLDFIPFVFRKKNIIVVGGDSGSGLMKGDSLGRIVDSVYRGQDEALLYGDAPYKVSRIGFGRREAEKEAWVI